MYKDRAFTENQLAEMMHTHGVRLSAQRIAVFSYVANGKLHPSAEEIFTALSPIFPSLSRTTVYNSLHLLKDKGLIRELEIQSGFIRYDLRLQEVHSHFICTGCGRITDMPMPAGIADAVLPDYAVGSVDVFIKGLCPDCKGRRKKDLKQIIY